MNYSEIPNSCYERCKMIEELIEKHKGERTFFDGELLGAYFTVSNLEKLCKDVIERCAKVCDDLPMNDGITCAKEIRELKELNHD